MGRTPWLIGLVALSLPCCKLNAQLTLPANADASQTNSDHRITRTQDMSLNLPALPDPAAPSLRDLEAGSAQPLTMEMALYGALTQNPDLVSLRQSTQASAEAVEVARHFPVALNPTLWIEARPWSFQPIREHGATQREARMPGYLYVSLRQPIELGHQQRYRRRIAEAAFAQARWTQIQAELIAVVQTYRFFQTAAYRREKMRIARELAVFNHQLVSSLEQRLEANQVSPADLALARVEDEAANQLAETAQMDYATALADLHNQLGTPETAGRSEPIGDFVLPPYLQDADERQYIEIALQSRPEIHAATAGVDGAKAAVGLSRADQIPTPVVGPLYVRDEALIQYYGFVFVMPLPVWNSGRPLVRQREAEYRQAAVRLEQTRQRTITQVRTALSRWNNASRLVSSVAGATPSLVHQVEVLQRLFDEGQADLNKLLQARQRLIQLENARLDAVWAATQAQSELLTALGARSLLGAIPQPLDDLEVGFPTHLPPEPR